MTYCVGVLLDSGLVMASDSRTNAGVDHVSLFPKMRVFSRGGERIIILTTSGNLAVSQHVINFLEQMIAENIEPNLMSVSSMFDAAQVVGQAVRNVHHSDAEALRRHHTEFLQSILLGGQILGEQPRLFNIYAAGNFIEACPQTPYFQIGETKYGKPIIDRVVKNASSLEEVVKCTLISFDSTIRSNLSVGLPIDLFVYPADSFNCAGRHRISEDDPYFTQLSQRWSEGLRQVFAGLPSPPWENPDQAT